MSITYDPDKWSSPLRATEIELPKKHSKSPVIVSLKELRYFNEIAKDQKPTRSITAFIEDYHRLNDED